MSVLKKKIEARTGVPPSLLSSERFWARLNDAVQEWSVETFGFDACPRLGVRKAVEFDHAIKRLDPKQAFGFQGAGSSLLFGSASQSCLVEAAAARMKQPAAGLEDSSKLFLRLLFEPSAKALGSKLLNMIDPGFADAPLEICEFSTMAEARAPGARCMQIEYALTFDGRFGDITLIFDFEPVLARARTLLHSEEEGRKAATAGHGVLAESVEASSVRLDAVLDEITLTVGRCSRLAAGDVLDLPNADAGHLTLRAETVGGPIGIGEGSLGTWRDRRALKLSGPLKTGFTRSVLHEQQATTGQR